MATFKFAEKKKKKNVYLREGGQREEAGGCTAGRLSHDGDPVGVTPEVPDIVPDPLEGRDLVQQAHVARSLFGVQAHEA